MNPETTAAFERLKGDLALATDARDALTGVVTADLRTVLAALKEADASARALLPIAKGKVSICWEEYTSEPTFEEVNAIAAELSRQKGKATSTP